MRRFFATIICALLISVGSVDRLVASQENDPVLSIATTINGIEIQNSYSMEELEALESTEFTTSTIWTEGEMDFQGVALDLLLDHLDIHDGTLELIASNDYFVQVPVQELRGTKGLLAYLLNGSRMSTRDKGPLWLVFPYDSDVNYQSETFYSRSIWQLSKIRVLP